MTSSQLPPLTEAERNRLTDCVFYQKGNCTKGEKCEFRHIDYLVGKVCKPWLQGECREPRCSFRHPTIKPKVDPSQTVCYFFTIGKCTKGNKCPFIHDKSKIVVETKVVEKEKPKKSLFSAAMKKLKEQEKKNEEKKNETTTKQQQEIVKKSIQRPKLSDEAKQKILNVVSVSQKSNGVSTMNNQQNVEQSNIQQNNSVPKMRKIKINRKRVLTTETETSPNKKLKTEEEEKLTTQPVISSMKEKPEMKDDTTKDNNSKENESNSSQDLGDDDDTSKLLAECESLLAE